MILPPLRGHTLDLHASEVAHGTLPGQSNP